MSSVNWQHLAQAFGSDSDLLGHREGPAAAKAPVELFDVVGEEKLLHRWVSPVATVEQTLDSRQSRRDRGGSSPAPENSAEMSCLLNR